MTSNVATCSILLPVLKELSVALEIHPLYLLLPVTLSCSYAFMLPVATPPNAIVYSASGMSTSEMVRPDPILFAAPLAAAFTLVVQCVFSLQMKVGLGMNIICVAVNIIWLHSYGTYIFQLNTFPQWAVAANLGL